MQESVQNDSEIQAPIGVIAKPQSDPRYRAFVVLAPGKIKPVRRYHVAVRSDGRFSGMAELKKIRPREAAWFRQMIASL